MTQRIPRALLVFLAVSAVTVGLAGCAPATTNGAGSSPGHATSTHTPIRIKKIPPALDVTAPASRLSLPCTSLATQAVITGYQGPVTLVQPAALAAGDLADADNMIPSADYVRDAGGIDCIWSTGPVDHFDQTSNKVPSYIEITVQFDAQHAWSLEGPAIGLDGNDPSDGGECDVDLVGSICQLDHLVGAGTWIDVLGRHSTGANDIEAIHDSVIAAVTAAGTPTAPTTPQAGTLALGTLCTDFASTSAVQTALGTSAAIAASTPLQGSNDYSIIPVEYAAQDTLKDHPCIFTAGAATIAQVAWLPGGAWAWAEDKTQALADAPLQTLHLTGLGVNDGAWIRCAAANASCVVDLTLGGNWIEVALPATSTATNKRSAVAALAQAVVTKLG
jgi:hypothetical protein